MDVATLHIDGQVIPVPDAIAQAIRVRVCIIDTLRASDHPLTPDELHASCGMVAVATLRDRLLDLEREGVVAHVQTHRPKPGRAPKVWYLVEE